MNVEIHDAAAFRRVSLVNLGAYLKSSGWSMVETWRGRVCIWIRESQDRSWKILVPLRDHLDDYVLRIGEAVATLAEVEERSQLQVYFELLEAGADVIRLRPADGIHAELSLYYSAVLFDQAQRLVTSAARVAERPGQPVYRGRVSGTVQDYVRSVRPVPGYEAGDGLTLHSMVPAEYGSQQDMGDGYRSPFGRAAVLALYAGLEEASGVIDTVRSGGGLSVFDEAAPRSVSSNICDALAVLAKDYGGVDVELTWARVRPAEVDQKVFRFDRDDGDLLSEWAERLRQASPFWDAPVKGGIIRLENNPPERFDGRSVLVYELDGRPVVLHVQFEPSNHQEVLRAFENGLEVSFSGDIYREGRNFVLKDPRNFVVVG